MHTKFKLGNCNSYRWSELKKLRRAKMHLQNRIIGQVVNQQRSLRSGCVIRGPEIQQLLNTSEQDFSVIIEDHVIVANKTNPTERI
jgi:hypothetical protein